MILPTEPIGSIPRSPELLNILRRYRDGQASIGELAEAYDNALQDTVRRFEATGSPVITDGEQRKSSFLTYPLEGLTNIADDGLVISFEDGHARRLPRLTRGPFRYRNYAVNYLQSALHYAHVPVKQAVISASALSLLYPEQGLADYSREQFLKDLVQQVANDIFLCLEAGAYRVQIDFTEGRLAVKLDPSKALLRLEAGNFYVQLASEKNPRRVLEIIKQNLQPHQRVFIGVIDVLDNTLETPETVRDRVLLAAEYYPAETIGDDRRLRIFAVRG